MNRIDAPVFWRWAFSDFLSNALRGVLAEYIVASAIGSTQKARSEWDAYDLVTEDGLKIEVKSSAYLQAWRQEKPSSIRFDIAHKQAWDAQDNTYSAQAIRAADVYVFCVFAATDRATADPLDLTQWFFMVCPTTWLTQKLGNQKSVGLASLEHHGIRRVAFTELAAAIHAARAEIVVNGV